MDELIKQIVSEWVIEKRVKIKSRRAAKVALRKDWGDLASLLDKLSLLTQRAADECWVVRKNHMLDEWKFCPICGTSVSTHR